VDGTASNDQENGRPGSVLGSNAGVDALPKFSVLTPTIPQSTAGRLAGLINANDKVRAQRKFHGTAYEFLRNSWLGRAKLL